MNVHPVTNKSPTEKSNASRSFKRCVQVPLEVADTEACMRIGDIYALIVETYVRNLDWGNALRMARDMEMRNIFLTPYLDLAMLEDIYRENGLSYTSAATTGPKTNQAQLSDEIHDEDTPIDNDGSDEHDDYAAYAQRMQM